METEATLHRIAKERAQRLPYTPLGYNNTRSIILTDSQVERIVFLSMRYGYDLGMEDAKEALKQQTNNKQTL